MVEGTITGNLKAKNHVYLQNAVFNRSTNTLNITAQNTGNTEANVEYAVNSDSNSFTGNLGTVSSGETTSFTVNTDETFPLQNVSLNVDGQHFSNSQKQIKCTPTKGLVGYWPFNDEQTQNDYVIDLSGYGNNGSLEGGFRKSRDAVIGNSMEVNPENRGQILIPDDNSLNPQNQLTLALWVKSRSFTDPKSQVFIDKGADKHNKGYAMRFHGWGPGLKWTVGNGTDSCGTSPWGRNPEESLWYHTAGTFDDGQIRMYRDSNLISNRNCGFNTIKETDFALSLGRRTDWRFGYLNGSMDEVRIYNRSLSQPEIQRLYQVRSEDWAVDACKLTN